MLEVDDRSNEVGKFLGTRAVCAVSSEKSLFVTKYIESKTSFRLRYEGVSRCFRQDGTRDRNDSWRLTERLALPW